MEAVIGGWVAGYIMATVTTVALTYLVIRVRDTAFIERAVSRDVPGVLLAVPISIGTLLIWTLVGVSAGMVFELADLADGDGGFGSPNVAFTSTVVILAAAPAVLLTILWLRQWWLWLLLAGSFAASFGWLMPLLATR